MAGPHPKLADTRGEVDGGLNWDQGICSIHIRNTYLSMVNSLSKGSIYLLEYKDYLLEYKELRLNVKSNIDAHVKSPFYVDLGI